MKRFWIGLIGLILISGLVLAQDKSAKNMNYDTNFISAGVGTSGVTLGAGFKLKRNCYIGFKTYHRYIFESWPYKSSDCQFLSLEIVLGKYVSEGVYVTMGEGRGRILKWFKDVTKDHNYLSTDIGIRLTKNEKNSTWIEFGVTGLPYTFHISFIARLGL